MKTMTAEKKKIDGDMNIGEILELYPEAQEVFRKHFGQGCFNCPASRLESISFGALMHNKDAKTLVRDLNAKIKS